MFLTIGALWRVFFTAVLYSLTGGAITTLQRFAHPQPFDHLFTITQRAEAGSHLGLGAGMAVGAFVATATIFRQRYHVLAGMLASALGGLLVFTGVQETFFGTSSRNVAITGVIFGALANALAGARPEPRSASVAALPKTPSDRVPPAPPA